VDLATIASFSFSFKLANSDSSIPWSSKASVALKLVGSKFDCSWLSARPAIPAPSETNDNTRMLAEVRCTDTRKKQPWKIPNRLEGKNENERDA
jgi:hypothetical protein